MRLIQLCIELILRVRCLAELGLRLITLIRELVGWSHLVLLGAGELALLEWVLGLLVLRELGCRKRTLLWRAGFRVVRVIRLRLTRGV